MVEQAGSLAGFAAVIGLAVLSALYFSQARDLRRLREWAGRAPERAAEAQPGAPAPGRVTAVPQRPAPAPKPPVGPAAQPATNGDAAPTVAAKPAEGDAEKKEEAGVAAQPEPAGAKATEGEAVAQKEEAKPAEGAAPARPAIPGPASAAAAAGAGAASVSAPGPAAQGAAAPPAEQKPAAPGAGATAAAAGAAAGAAGAAPRTTPQPQRPPGSVLPPRTGTLPPVRRLPASNVGPAPAQTGILGSAPPPKQRRNPVYIALAVAGVLILGAAAAVGVPALVNGSKHKAKSTKSATQKTAHHAPAPLTPSKITVAVLNGTSIPGLAAQIGDRVNADGFTLGTVSNASPSQGQRANSVAMYAPGHARDARLVGRRLGISNVEPVDSNSRQIAGDATVVVIVGSDKTQ